MSAAASNVKPVSISCDTATDGMPISVPSKAAETVPEYVTSSPRLSPRLMPENRSFGRSSLSRCSTPQFTQSVGVPSTDQRWGPMSFARSGWCSVSECPAALLSWSGATVNTSPTVASDEASRSIPSEKMPSSLVTMMRGRLMRPEAPGCRAAA